MALTQPKGLSLTEVYGQELVLYSQELVHPLLSQLGPRSQQSSQSLQEEACLRSPQRPLADCRDCQDPHPPLVLMPELTQEMPEEE